jgi:hypothetical protein
MSSPAAFFGESKGPYTAIIPCFASRPVFDTR